MSEWGPPGPVTGLATGAITTTSIALSWTNPTDADLASVIVRRAVGATPPATAAAGTAVTLANPTATTVTDTGLTATTGYAYAVFTRDTTGNTSTAVTITATTSTPPDTTPPPPVIGLAPGTITSTSIALSWTNPVDADLAQIVVRRATGATAPATATEGPGSPCPPRPRPA